VRTAVGDPITALGTIADGRKPLLAVRLGQAAQVAALTGVGDTPRIASYAGPAAAVAVLGRLAEYTRRRARASPAVPIPSDVDVPGAVALVRANLRAVPAGGWLDPLVTSELLRCFGIPMVEPRFAVDADAAVAVFAEPSGPVVVKAVAEGVLHKSAQSGVLLDVRDEAGVRAAVAELTDRFGSALLGLLVQPMAAKGRELLVGVHSDGVFGPLVVFGLGGVDTDVVADRTARPAPLGVADADDLLASLRSSGKLFGPDMTLDTAAVRDVVIRIGLLAQILPEVVEMDLNPLIARPAGHQVVDARIRLAPAASVDPFLPSLRG
jgi:acyl-CoA synthetase (NDP forming)